MGRGPKTTPGSTYPASLPTEAPKRHRFRLAYTTYSVDAESRQTLKLDIPARTLALAKRSWPRYPKGEPILRERKLRARVRPVTQSLGGAQLEAKVSSSQSKATAFESGRLPI